jgi:hypothetical protein
MRNLDIYGVRELNAREIKKTNGGGFLAWVFGALNGIGANVGEGLKHSNIHKGTGLIAGQKW